MVNRDQGRRGVVGLVVGVVVGVGLVAVAGDVDPPGGVVSGTMKTLEDVEARVALRNDPLGAAALVIDAPGSYYLAESIVALPGEHGIEIDSDDVTLDLNGYEVRGDAGGTSLDGIHINNESVDRTGIAIRNGIVRGFGGDGVDNLGGEACVFEGLRIRLCDGDGITTSSACLVTACVVRECDDGIRVASGSVVRGCSCLINSGVGITSHGGLVVDCATSFNTTNLVLDSGAQAYDTLAP